tara:strand:+ start:4984 stop:5475 length:492 start_codon:yes stop_codon:yes gene_type:complete
MSLVKTLRQWFSTAPDTTEPMSTGDQILHDSFNHLQNFVEYYIAQIYVGSSDETFRSREKGIQGIEWLHSQKNKDPIYQSALSEIKILYNWWVDLRTQRSEAWKDVDTTYSQFKQEWLETTEDKNSEYKQFMDKCRHAEKLQKLYNTEDTKMLLRLIQIRNYL